MNQQSVWDKIAPEWKIYRQKVSPSVINFLKGKSGKVLDDGSGSGRNFTKMKGISWYACDFSDEMIRFADENAKKKRMDVQLVRADSTSLLYDDNFFDYVICVAVLHCIETPEKRKKAFEEIYRVLKKNGEALISVWGWKNGRLKNKKKEDFVPWTIRRDEVIFKELRYNYIFELDELKTLAEKVGFSVERAWEERNVNLIVKKIN